MACLSTAVGQFEQSRALEQAHLEPAHENYSTNGKGTASFDKERDCIDLAKLEQPKRGGGKTMGGYNVVPRVRYRVDHLVPQLCLRNNLRAGVAIP